jgi:pentatricopeptide repeat protein
LAYAKSGKALDAEKVLREMVKDGLRPDGVTYTTVIDAYKRNRNIQKCWELYEYYTTNVGFEFREGHKDFQSDGGPRLP